MNLSELKLAAIKLVILLNKKEDVEEILLHLKKMFETESKNFETDIFFEKAVEKYDNVLKRLSE